MGRCDTATDPSAGTGGPALDAPALARRGHDWRRAGGERQPYGLAEPQRAMRVTRRAGAEDGAAVDTPGTRRHPGVFR